jgi:hypothetical protein
MADTFGIELEKERSGSYPVIDAIFLEEREFSAIPFQYLDDAPSELSARYASASTCVRIDLEDLKCFEVVERQYQDLGVTFSNAIAIEPSNPAFPAYSGSIVLFGSPRDGWLEATFEFPVQFVSGFVTGSRRTVLVAFDVNGKPVARTEAPDANLAGSGTEVPPNLQLSLKAANIYRVTFQTLDGQLTLDDFCFSH